MGLNQNLKRIFMTGLLIGITGLVNGCQSDSKNVTLTGNPTTTVTPLSAVKTETPPVVPGETAQPTTRSSPTSLPSTATKMPTKTVTAIPSEQSTTADSSEYIEFLPKIALLAGNPGSYSSIGVFNTETKALQILDQPSETLSFGGPLWSPNKDLLAYAQLDADTPSIKIRDVESADTHLLKVTEPKEYDGDEDEPGMYLFGWSHNAEWLAYDFIYESAVPRDLHLINRNTQENIAVDGTGRVFWFAWSPHSTAFTISDSEAIYYGFPSSPDEMKVYEGGKELGLINWHPEKNELLVARTENLASDGYNLLWSLNLDTGEWILVGTYPEISNFTYSPDGRSIAVYSNMRIQGLNRLTIINARTFDAIEQIELPKGVFFSELDWLDNVVALTSKDNIYMVPLEQPQEPYWLLVPKNNYFSPYSSILFTDW